jgi:chromate reductase, NAD(P)H dehydrogenase (quinone)
MVLIINGTNRPNNKTQHISQFCVQYLKESTDLEVRYINLEDLTSDIINSNMYSADGQAPFLNIIQDDLIIPFNKWIIISPEYNGSFPGILKLFIDALSVRKYGQTFAGKKVGLIGVASGRAGNLRGMEHLTSLLNYLKVTVFYNKLPISSISSVLNQNNEVDENNLNALKAYLDEFIAWSK